MESIAEAIIKSGLVEVTLTLQVTQLNSQFVSQKKKKKKKISLFKSGPLAGTCLELGHLRV